MRIVLIGPQGSGKGTQGQRLAQKIGGRHLATGDLVRAEIAAGTPLGHSIRASNDRGELVPDAIMVGLVRPYLTASDSWVLDGFPRDLAQARALDAMLAGAGFDLDRVIALEAPDDLLIDRLSGRRQSAATGKTYHIIYDPPPADDPGPFVRRADDTSRDIQRRLEIYHGETEPLKEYYANRGLLTQIDACGNMDEVSTAVDRALKQTAPERSTAAG